MTGHENADMLEKYLQENEWPFNRTDTDRGSIFTGGVGALEGAYDAVKIAVVAEERVIQSYAFLPAKAKGKLQEMAEFLHGANYGLRQGAFELDWKDGEIRFHLSYPDCVLQTEDKDVCLMSLFLLPVSMITKYSKGMVAILINSATPEEALRMCDDE